MIEEDKIKDSDMDDVLFDDQVDDAEGKDAGQRQQGSYQISNPIPLMLLPVRFPLYRT